MTFIDGMIENRFLPAAHRDGVVVHADPDDLIDGLAAYQKVTVPKWL
jgi:hypothetical protein